MNSLLPSTVRAECFFLQYVWGVHCLEPQNISNGFGCSIRLSDFIFCFGCLGSAGFYLMKFLSVVVARCFGVDLPSPLHSVFQ